MEVTGACHCQNIKYAAEIDPDKVGICHCTDCQRLSGSAFRTIALTDSSGFRLITGKLSEYLKTAENGNKRIQTFCPKCGSPIYSASVNEPREFSIRVGTIDQVNDLVPKFQLWRRSAQKWLPDLSKLDSSDMQ